MSEPQRIPFARAPTAIEDPVLDRRVAIGDLAAFETVLHQHWPAIVRFAARMLGDDDAAKDIAQETFVRLWLHRSEVRSGCLRAMLYRIARNLILDEERRMAVRARWRATERPDLALVNDPRPNTFSDVRDETVRLAVDALPPRRREAFALVYLFDFSYKEASLVLGIAPATVKNQVAAALATLRETLAPYHVAQNSGAG